MHCRLPGCSVRGILQAGVLEWGCHFLFQGIFLTLGWNPGLLLCRQTLYCLNHQGSPQAAVGVRPMQIKKHGEVPLHTKPNKKEWEIRVVDEYGTDEPVCKVEIETLYREQTLRSPRQERGAWGPLGDWNGHMHTMDAVDKTGE